MICHAAWAAYVLIAMTFGEGASGSSAPCFFFPTTGVRTESIAVLLAIDDASLPLAVDAASLPDRLRSKAVLRGRRQTDR